MVLRIMTDEEWGKGHWPQKFRRIEYKNSTHFFSPVKLTLYDNLFGRRVVLKSHFEKVFISVLLYSILRMRIAVGHVITKNGSYLTLMSFRSRPGTICL